MCKEYIADYKKFYEIFMKIRNIKRQQEYTVVPAGKNKANKDETNTKR